MEDRSTQQKNWYELGSIIKTDPGWIIKDLLVRWDERIVSASGPEGDQPVYIYTACRFNYPLPAAVQPGTEAVEYYLEQAQPAIIQLAQDLLAQEEGFHGS